MTISDKITLVLSQQLVDYWQGGVPNNVYLDKFKQNIYFCSQSHWSDECSSCKTLQERREKLKGSCYACLKKGHMSKNCIKDTKCGKKNEHHRNLCPTLFPSSDSSLSSIEDSIEAKPTEVIKTNVSN